MHSFMGYDIPVALIEKTGSGVEHFEAVAALHMNMLAERAPVAPEHTVLELGCGIGRDAIPLARILSDEGRYIGIDIDRESIEWCSANITPEHANFRFHYFDVFNESYNKRGTISTSDIRLPAEDGSVDRVIAQSVFTHLVEPDAMHYFRELRRVLAPDGLVVATFFIATPSEIESSRANSIPAFRFHHARGDGFYVNNERQPEDSVAVTQEKLVRMLEQVELKLARPIEFGYWHESRSHTVEFGQDIAVLSRAAD